MHSVRNLIITSWKLRVPTFFFPNFGVNNYHPGKANVVADALSWKSHYNTLEALLEDGFNLLHFVVLHNITISCSLESKIIELQKIDVGIFHIKRKM